MIEIRNLSKTFTTENGETEVLKNVSLSIRDGEIYGIIGASGAGKSTLLRSLNMLERPTSGSVLIDGEDVSALRGKALRDARKKTAMIFQDFNLLMQRTCLKNVCFPMELAGIRKAEARKRAKKLLETVGLSEKADVYPVRLSGGQRQRVAIARALASDPKILLCDEPTSALDPQTSKSVLGLIREINRATGITVVIITHQMSAAEEICDRVAILDGGSVAEEGEVNEVFSRPRSAAAKRLVFPDLPEEGAAQQPGEKRLRVVFHGAAAAGSPLIATLAMEKRIAVSILSASMRNLGEKVYGNMLLSVPTAEAAKQTIGYLRSVPDVFAEEVTDDVV